MYQVVLGLKKEIGLKLQIELVCLGMLPLSLLRAAKDSALLVELKSGDTYNGRLSSCDAYMNLNLVDVVCTSAAGDRFWKLPACYIRGSAIKYLRLPEPCLEKAIEDEEKEQQSNVRGGGGGARGGRARGGRDNSGRAARFGEWGGGRTGDRSSGERGGRGSVGRCGNRSTGGRNNSNRSAGNPAGSRGGGRGRYQNSGS